MVRFGTTTVPFLILEPLNVVMLVLVTEPYLKWRKSLRQQHPPSPRGNNSSSRNGQIENFWQKYFRFLSQYALKIHTKVQPSRVCCQMFFCLHKTNFNHCFSVPSVFSSPFSPFPFPAFLFPPPRALCCPSSPRTASWFQGGPTSNHPLQQIHLHWCQTH